MLAWAARVACRGAVGCLLRWQDFGVACWLPAAVAGLRVGVCVARCRDECAGRREWGQFLEGRAATGVGGAHGGILWPFGWIGAQCEFPWLEMGDSGLGASSW